MLEKYKESIEALVDGELDSRQKKHILQLIQHVPELQAYYSTLMKQKYVLQKWWGEERDKIH
tara:strand:+ start:1691 stop:1876 length:186 start_codon:yes stop_codon:yes gene_type:complete